MQTCHADAPNVDARGFRPVESLLQPWTRRVESTTRGVTRGRPRPVLSPRERRLALIKQRAEVLGLGRHRRGNDMLDELRHAVLDLARRLGAAESRIEELIAERDARLQAMEEYANAATGTQPQPEETPCDA